MARWLEPKEGFGGAITTSVVSKYEGTTERGIKVCIFDTPGFGDVLSDEKIIAMMLKETESQTKGKLDLVLFCLSLGNTCVQEVHTKAEVLHFSPGLQGLGVLFNCHA